MYGVMRTNGSGTDWARRCATVLSRALGFSRKRGLIDSNPTKGATRPRSTRSKPHSPTVASGEVHISAAITDAGPGKKIQRKAARCRHSSSRDRNQ